MSAGLGGLISSGSGAGEAVAAGTGLDDGAVEREPDDDGRAEPGVSEGLGPAAGRLVGGDGHAVLLLAFGHDLEEEFGAVAVEFHVAEPINAQKINSAVAGDGLGQLLLTGGLNELVDQLRGRQNVLAR